MCVRILVRLARARPRIGKLKERITEGLALEDLAAARVSLPVLLGARVGVRVIVLLDDDPIHLLHQSDVLCLAEADGRLISRLMLLRLVKVESDELAAAALAELEGDAASCCFPPRVEARAHARIGASGGP